MAQKHDWTKRQVGRLAMREEGHMWNAYYALPDTMKDAVFLGSIVMRAVSNNLDRKHAFMDMMRQVVTEILQENVKAGQVSWDNEPSPAPQHERSGKA